MYQQEPGHLPHSITAPPSAHAVDEPITQPIPSYAGVMTGNGDRPPAQSALALAADDCSAGVLEDDGTTLIVDTNGTETGSGDETFDDLVCVLATLSVPSYVTSQMDQTRTLDGMQEAEWSIDGQDFTAKWTYHRARAWT